MMNNRTYIYLDSQEDREQLVAEVKAVRSDVLKVASVVPQEEWYSPRYHNWSLAAMLAHLNMMDQLTLFLIQASLLNIHPRVPMRFVNPLNNWTSQIFQRRVIDSTKRNTAKNEHRITEFILRLPVHQFSKTVYYSPFEQYTTVEKALQDYYVYHWREHLQTMLMVEGIPYPPSHSDIGS